MKNSRNHDTVTQQDPQTLLWEFPEGAFYCGSKHASTLQLGERPPLMCTPQEADARGKGMIFVDLNFLLCVSLDGLSWVGDSPKKSGKFRLKCGKYLRLVLLTPPLLSRNAHMPPWRRIWNIANLSPYTRKPSITKNNTVTATPMKIGDRGPRCRRQVQRMNIKFQKECSWGRPSRVQKNTPQAKVQECRRQD